MVIFAQHDLVKNPPYCNMHLISCRNLLIYMTAALQKRIFNMMLFGLRLNGYLFLGASENPQPILPSLEEIHKQYKIYKNIEPRRNIHFDVFTIPELKPSPSFSSPLQAEHNASPVLADMVAGALANDLGCVAICVDENDKFLKSFGDTEKYLLQKNFTLHLPDLLPKPLAIAFAALRKDALKSGNKETIRAIPFSRDDKTIPLVLSVSAIDTKRDTQKLLLITLHEDVGPMAPQEDIGVFNEQKYHDQHVANLEDELKELKQKLNDAYVRLDATNENLQSFNEELLSTNEEMQSTNEEMQSVNEELHTINADYQLKNKELQELNDDLNNYFRSNVNGQIFVNARLQLMKFSPATVKLINLLPSDIGRPLSHISTNIKLETFVSDIEAVLQTGSVITKEIESKNGDWYQVVAMPYVQQADNHIKGAILTFNDITELKQTQAQLNSKNESLLRINNDLDNFVHTASHDLLSPLGNIEVSIDVMNQLAGNTQELLPMLQIIKSSVTRFRALIHQISYIAKTESEMLAMEWVNMDEITSNAEWSLADKILSSGVEIVKEFAVKQIYFSKKNLQSIVFNLLSNAIKFRTGKHPLVTISTAKQNDYTVLRVQDNGIGISPCEIDKIFSIYGRLNNDIEGTGIGLHLAKKIVDAAGGDILVESEEGKGTTFIILLKCHGQLV